MSDYRDVYLDSVGLSRGDRIKCSCCSAEAVDIHHIFARQMGGSKLWDFPFNLIALCRTCHDRYGDKKQYYTFLLSKRVKLTQEEKEEIKSFPNIFRGYNVPRKFIYYLNYVES